MQGSIGTSTNIVKNPNKKASKKFGSKCPKCKIMLEIKDGKYGQYLNCTSCFRTYNLKERY